MKKYIAAAVLTTVLALPGAAAASKHHHHHHGNIHNLGERRCLQSESRQWETYYAPAYGRTVGVCDTVPPDEHWTPPGLIVEFTVFL